MEVDSEACPNASYCPQRLKVLQSRQLSSHDLAVMTGALVSPARYHVMLQNSRNLDKHAPGCPWCGMAAATADWNHVVWKCPAIIPPPGLAESSCDELERRLGWPQPSGDSVDWKTLDWMTKVRTVTLSDRHDPD